jgi:hypothetical protein
MTALHPVTIEFLKFLKGSPGVRQRIRAFPNRTLLYAGDLPNRFATLWFAALPPAVRPAKQPKMRDGVVMTGVWNRLAEPAERDLDHRDKQILPQVLEAIQLPGTRYASLLDYAKDAHSQVPEDPDQSIIWRALSGIFAANAVGAVSFFVGNDVTAVKVLATTEIPVLLRNPNVDATTKDILAYYQRCIARGDQNLVSLTHG